MESEKMRFWVIYGDDIGRMVGVLAAGATGISVNLALTNEIMKLLVSLGTLISIGTMLYFAWREHDRRSKTHLADELRRQKSKQKKENQNGNAE